MKEIVISISISTLVVVVIALALILPVVANDINNCNTLEIVSGKETSYHFPRCLIREQEGWRVVSDVGKALEEYVTK